MSPDSVSRFDVPEDREPKAEWFLVSIGPDMLISCGAYLVYGEDIVNQMEAYEPGDAVGSSPGAIYDATNGTVSIGDIVRIGP